MRRLLLPALLLSSALPVIRAQPVLPRERPPVDARLPPLFSIKAHEFSFYYLAFSDDGKSVITVGDDRLSKVWDIDTKKCVQTFVSIKGGAACFSQFSSAKHSYMSLFAKLSSPEGKPTILTPGWEVHENELKAGATKVLHKWEGDARPVALWMDRKTVVISTHIPGDPESYALEFYDLETKKPHVLRVGEVFNVLSFSSDRSLVILKVNKGFVKVMDWKNAKTVAQVQTITDFVNEELQAGILLPDNQTLLAINSFSQSIQVWELKTRKLTKVVHLLGSPDGKAELSPDGRLLATFDSNRVWFFDTKALKYVAQQQTGKGLQIMRFTPDGTRYAVGDRQGKLQVFAVPKLPN